MNDAIRFLMQVGLIAKIVLGVLLIISIISWAVILEKLRQFNKIRKETRKFFYLFKMQPAWNELYNHSRNFQHSPFPMLVKKFYTEIIKGNSKSPAYENSLPLEENVVTAGKRTRVSPATVLGAAQAEEISGMEKRLIILSTTVSVSPFLGLLGTVWGIMSAFMSIGMTGSADLATVGPGIAEALITTVAGLAAAIPALIAYNYFVDYIRRIDGKLDSFTTDLLRISDKESAE